MNVTFAVHPVPKTAEYGVTHWSPIAKAWNEIGTLTRPLKK